MYDIAIAISLERRKDRRVRLEQHLSERGIHNIYYLPAYDGALIAQGVMKVTPPHRSYFTFRDEITNLRSSHMNRFQVACALSHIAALKFAKMMKVETALILEDDVELEDNFSLRVEELKNETSGLQWEHIYLGGAVRKTNIVMKQKTKHLWTTGFTDGLQAYLVKGRGFDKISNAMLSFNTTSDDTLNDIISREENKLEAYMYLPKIAFQICDFSELDRKIIDRQDLRKTQ